MRITISWRIISVDSAQRTAVVAYVCGSHRIDLNISIGATGLEDKMIEAEILRASPMTAFVRLSNPSYLSLDGLVGRFGDSEIDLGARSVSPRTIATAGTVVE